VGDERVSVVKALNRKHSTHSIARRAANFGSRLRFIYIRLARRPPMSPLLIKISKDLKLVCCPRALAPSLVTLPSMSLNPFAPLKLTRCPYSLAATLTALPSMSLNPFAPLYLAHSRSARPLPIAASPAMSLIPFAPFDDMMENEQRSKYGA